MTRLRCFFSAGALAIFVALTSIAPAIGAQPTQSSSSQPVESQPTPTQPDPDQPAPPAGKVLFSRDASAASDAPQPDSPQPDAQKNPADAQKTPQRNDPLAVTDAERNALTFTAYDLDAHLTPASAAISVRAGLTMRNDSPTPLRRLVLEISSSLHWDAFSSHGPSGAVAPLTFAAHSIETDADHTGLMDEAVITLPQPLAPGASITLTALYSGTIPPSAERLTRIGAPADQALSTDWDAIASNSTALRGFGNVLWYPVAAARVFLGDGAKLFQAVGSTKLRQSAATFRLRVAVEYVGDPPDAVYFCGHREQLTAISDNPNAPIAESPGIATAVFDPRPLGFRMPNLFITASAANQTGTPTNPGLIAAITDRSDALPAYVDAATLVEPLLTDWFGAQPLTALTILDHPGQPFEDDALLVRPMNAVEPATLTAPLAHSLTHAWIHSSQPWIDEGLAQFVSLLWIERTSGRAAALAEMQDAARPLALIEPEVPASASSTSSSSLSSDSPSESSDLNQKSASAQPLSPAGESLAAATGEVFYRTKAAAVWWMLRNIVGDDVLKQALQAYRLDAKLDRDPEGLEHTIEKFSPHMDLHWFFNDWVYRDRGLPDLSITSVTPSQLETRSGRPSGWLVAVDVRNDGYAEVEVPITVRSLTVNSSETHMLRIPGRSSASTRILFSGTPEEVEVNDGSIPETQTSIHTRKLILPGH